METLKEDAARQCGYMKNLTQEEKGFIIETAAKIKEKEESNGNTIPEPVKANEEAGLIDENGEDSGKPRHRRDCL